MPDHTIQTVQAPSWATVAPLLARWQMALLPNRDRSWDVLSASSVRDLPFHEARRVPFAQLPQTIADVAARCEAAAQGEGGDEPHTGDL